MQTRSHVFLLGFMGCGKTYWGQLLAKKLSMPFLDLDDLITTTEGRSIADIFAENGESGFRDIEREALHRLPELPPTVVATGGGTPCYFDNMEWLNANGTTIYLKTSSSLLVDRLKHEKEIRPILSAVNDTDLQCFIEEKVGEREPYYLQADVVLEQPEANEVFFKQLWNASRNI